MWVPTAHSSNFPRFFISLFFCLSLFPSYLSFLLACVKACCPQGWRLQTSWNQKVDDVDSQLLHYQPNRRMSMSWCCDSPLCHPVFKNLPCKPLGSELLRRQSPGDAGRPDRVKKWGFSRTVQKGRNQSVWPPPVCRCHQVSETWVLCWAELYVVPKDLQRSHPPQPQLKNDGRWREKEPNLIIW